MAHDENGNLVSVNEACSLAGVSRRTIYNWLEADKIRYIRTAGGAPRIEAASLFAAGNVPVAAVAPRIAAALVVLLWLRAINPPRPSPRRAEKSAGVSRRRIYRRDGGPISAARWLISARLLPWAIRTRAGSITSKRRLLSQNRVASIRCSCGAMTGRKPDPTPTRCCGKSAARPRNRQSRGLSRGY
jgi:excisionase family DNA binding protein